MPVKYKVQEISQNFVAFSEYRNFAYSNSLNFNFSSSFYFVFELQYTMLLLLQWWRTILNPLWLALHHPRVCLELLLRLEKKRKCRSVAKLVEFQETIHENWIGKVHTLYNVLLRIARKLLETKENVKISTHPGYHMNLDWFSWEWSKKKIQNGRFFKMAVFENRQFSRFFR